MKRSKIRTRAWKVIAAMALMMLPAFIAFAAPMVSIEKTADVSTSSAGGAIVYTIRVVNQGDTAATGVTVSDTLDTDLNLLTTSPTTTVTTSGSGQKTLTWNLGTLATSTTTATTTLSFTVSSSRILAGTRSIANTARVSGDNFSPSISTAVVQVNQPNPIVTITKSPTAAIVSAGGNLSYTITATNTGGSTATGVVITDDVGAKLTYMSASPAPSSTQTVGIVPFTRLAWNVGTMAPGASYTATINTRVDSDLKVGDVLLNSANVSGSDVPSFTSTASSLVAGTADGSFVIIPDGTAGPDLGGIGGEDPGTVAGAADALPRTGVDWSVLLLIAFALAGVAGWKQKTDQQLEN